MINGLVADLQMNDLLMKDVYDINLTASTTKVAGENSTRLELEDYILFGQVALENMNFDRFHIW